MKELLRLEEITKKFGNVTAVDSVDLQVYYNEFITILGPSGSGKTTILRMIAGFEQPTSGRIILNGRDIGNTPANKRPFTTVFQDYALFPHMTVFSNVAYGLTVKHVKKAEINSRVREALQLVELTGYERRYPDQLSGGQRQRVALARSLILRPELLLLDEPLGALDLALRKKMQINLKKIQENVKITFLHVTHDQEEGLSISDRIVIINDGRIQQIDAPKEIYFKPKNYFSAKFMGENNLIEGRVAGSGDNGALIVDTEIGVFKCTSRGIEKHSPGEEVFLVIRPENILILEGGKRGADNMVDSVLKRAVFIGSEEKIIVSPKTLPEFELMAKQHSFESGVHGREVKIGWSSDTCWMISKQPGVREKWSLE